MTDIYISYAREDRERVRPLAESLQFEGWDVWWDPSDPVTGGSAALDHKLGSAGAILVVWSGYSRSSEYVRSEAATGLYKNKLIQVRVDNSTPPRPFDQVDVIDLSYWVGERDDANWRQTLSAIRLFAGAPQMAQSLQPFVSAKAPKKAKAPTAAKAPRPVKVSRSSPAYLERERSVAPGPLVVIGLTAAAVAAVWFGDPFGIRSGGAKSASEPELAAAEIVPTSATPQATATAEVKTIAFEESSESERAWAGIDRNDPQSLRKFMAQFPKSGGAETARSLLRVIDAQAWVEAVTSDNEKGYTTYLAKFPGKGPGAGAMASAAEERLSSLKVERGQAIEEIQRGLADLHIYKGAIDGKSGYNTSKAVGSFATSKGAPTPQLASAAPRELRQFADMIQAELGGSYAVASSQPIIATATTPGAVKVASATDAADAADRLRREQAVALAAQAIQSADGLAAAELVRTADLGAWRDAERIGTAVAYQAYLSGHPTGQRVTDARAMLVKLTRPSPFSLDLVTPDVRIAAEAARRAQSTAATRATAARATAEAAQSAPGLRSLVAADGDKFEAQIANGAPNGLGTRTSASPREVGDRYRGEIHDGLSTGLGVYEFADNANNIAGIARYEGELQQDNVSGFGVTYWKNGDNFAGLKAGDAGAQRGVLSFTNGQRYEGELRNGVRDGFGVVWSSDGDVVMGGKWENGKLVQPMMAPLPPALPVALVPTSATGPQAAAPTTGGGE